MTTLHITNGDAAGDKLRRIVHGRVTITADVLHEGPAPAVGFDEWYETRARFLASGHGVAFEEVRTQLAAWDGEVRGAVEGGDAIVLWFEHDLFDQLLLIRTLDLLFRLTTHGQASVSATPGVSRASQTPSMICIDAFPGIDRFVGLGQLTTDQLATLIGAEQPVSAAQFASASAAWDAFRSPDPTELLRIARSAPVGSGSHLPLPFLPDALLRFCAEYPSTANGLSRTEQLALERLSAGPTTAGELFVATQMLEPRPFMGDATFFAILGRLACARVPLVAFDTLPDTADARAQRISITDGGSEVLAARADHVALNGIDLWRGGVHLVGIDRSPWRWDARRETLVS